MAYKHRSLWVNGVPPAPLIGERLSAIDFHFMKSTADLRKKMPFMTMEEITIDDKSMPGDSIIGQMMIAGFYNSVLEIGELVEEDLKHRKYIKKTREGCMYNSKQIRLGRNIKKLKMLAQVLCELEQLGDKGQWKMVIIARLELAEAMEKIDTWLASRIVLSCFRFISNLNKSIPEDRIIIAEIYLTKAYFLFKANHVDDNELHQHLQTALKMLSNHPDKKMYSIMSHKETPKREGVIRIEIERPVGLHGWHNYDKVTTVQEIVTLKNTSLYRIGCVIASLYQINCAQKQVADLVEQTSSGSTIFGHNNEPEEEEDEEYEDAFIELQQQTFSNAIAFANAGENASCMLAAIYVCGTYMKQHKQYDKARYVFKQLQFKSQQFNDHETLGITYNRLGIISKHDHKISEAMDWFGQEFEVGFDLNLPILRIDALLDLGRLLLEEGHVVEAETLTWHAYEDLSEVIKRIATLSVPNQKVNKKTKKKEIDHQEFQRIKYSFKSDPIYENAWATTGVAAGQSNWARFAGNCRNRQIYPLVRWKSHRHPIHAVWEQRNPRPVKITSAKSHYDVKRLARKIKNKQNLKWAEQDEIPKELQEQARWMEEIDDENFSSIHDNIVLKLQKLSASISEESEERIQESEEHVENSEEHVENSEEHVENSEENQDITVMEEEVLEEDEITVEKESSVPTVPKWESEIGEALQEIYIRRQSRAEEEFRAEVFMRIKMRSILRGSTENSPEEDEESTPEEEEDEHHDDDSLSDEGSEEGSEEEEPSIPTDDDEEEHEEEDWIEENEEQKEEEVTENIKIIAITEEDGIEEETTGDHLSDGSSYTFSY